MFCRLRHLLCHQTREQPIRKTKINLLQQGCMWSTPPKIGSQSHTDHNCWQQQCVPRRRGNTHKIAWDSQANLLQCVVNTQCKICVFDIKIFYLGTLLDRFEYVRVKFNEIPQEFIDKYSLADGNGDGWTYFEIRKRCYGFPQSSKLANGLLWKCIAKHGYYECATPPGLWLHQWCPINFILLVDDFGAEYVGERHSRHLQMELK